ncbi:hypothetical protein FHY19_002850 [Xanthomonas arboricola]|nr:hypothetical protein [Xanthomonas sp. 4461]
MLRLQLECCGRKTIRLTRFVTDDGNAPRHYNIQYTPAHDPEYTSGLISLWQWVNRPRPT